MRVRVGVGASYTDVGNIEVRNRAPRFHLECVGSKNGEQGSEQ